jgi:hypothetical protein
MNLWPLLSTKCLWSKLICCTSWICGWRKSYKMIKISVGFLCSLAVLDNLNWNDHDHCYIIKKVNKHIYSVVQSKWVKGATCDIVQFFSICIRPILEYSCLVFHHGLPEYLSLAIERVQKHVLSIIYPSVESYTDWLEVSGLFTLQSRHEAAES